MKENNFNLKKIREIISFIICGIQHRTANTLKRTNKGIKKNYLFFIKFVIRKLCKKRRKKTYFDQKKIADSTEKKIWMFLVNLSHKKINPYCKDRGNTTLPDKHDRVVQTIRFQNNTIMFKIKSPSPSFKKINLFCSPMNRLDRADLNRIGLD